MYFTGKLPVEYERIMQRGSIYFSLETSIRLVDNFTFITT